MTSTLQNIVIIYSYFLNLQQTWRTGKALTAENIHPFARGLMIFISFVPYWFRFGQCLHKYFMAEEGAKKTAHLQLFNAGKYATSLVAALAYIWITENIIDGAFVAWLIIQFFSQAAHCAWDFYVDWGLFRTNRSGIQNRFLREKMIFAPYFYYTAIGVNIFLRFFFLVMIAFMVEPGNDV
jgi:hypothetical protein